MTPVPAIPPDVGGRVLSSLSLARTGRRALPPISAERHLRRRRAALRDGDRRRRRSADARSRRSRPRSAARMPPRPRSRAPGDPAGARGDHPAGAREGSGESLPACLGTARRSAPRPPRDSDARRPARRLLAAAARAAQAALAAGVAHCLVALVGDGALVVDARPNAPVAERSAILVSDIANGTADPDFDGTLRQAVSVYLGAVAVSGSRVGRADPQHAAADGTQAGRADDPRRCRRALSAARACRRCSKAASRRSADDGRRARRDRLPHRRHDRARQQRRGRAQGRRPARARRADLHDPAVAR